MTAAALLIDFGSTFTKLRAVDLEAAHVIGSGQGPSTVTTDVTEGLHKALGDLEHRIGWLPDFKHRLACSSAAGGLRMVTVGLVPELTAEAARRAALGAGAKLTGTFAYRLTEGDMHRIESIGPDIILLAGGTDGGNREVIVENAKRLAASSLACPVVVAGNRDAADEAASALARAGKPVTVAGNVMPEFGRLDVEPARAAIRQVFIDRIVHAKGIDRAAAMFDVVLMPTPAAVLEGARLLADGVKGKPGLGPLVVVDVGGATTDVHSVAEGAPTREGVVPHGLPEPVVKRTVEGDLGMRINAKAIAEAVGFDAIAVAADLDQARVRALFDKLTANVERLPQSDDERRLDRALAEAALRIAMTRHAGTITIVQTVTGPVSIQTGKDLSDIKVLIGTGGVLAHGAGGAAMIKCCLADPAEPHTLRPRAPDLYLDSDYLLFACGLLNDKEPEAALTLGLRHMHPVGNNVS
ncbi:MAG: glutamate mutase L [Rhodospirillales bacterium]|nr:glutamate mutase L [Rhodospirillales bacterium]